MDLLHGISSPASAFILVFIIFFILSFSPEGLEAGYDIEEFSSD
jgi:hypothetical protein